jgi:hypothetical protein
MNTTNIRGGLRFLSLKVSKTPWLYEKRRENGKKLYSLTESLWKNTNIFVYKSLERRTRSYTYDTLTERLTIDAWGRKDTAYRGASHCGDHNAANPHYEPS